MELTPNILAFVGLSNEYCSAMENPPSDENREDFIATMLKLLPRLYISASDLPDIDPDDEDIFLADALDEECYDSIREKIAALTGEDDTFLEVMEEDMKYSDTPIAGSVSECLADIYQALYNFIHTVRDAPPYVIAAAAVAEKEEFKSYWSQTLCNVMRILNKLMYN